MSPVELDPVGKDLHVVLDLLVSGSSRSQQEQLALNQEDDGGDVEIIRRVTKACGR